MDVPAALHQKIELFRPQGRVVRWPEDLFTEDSWIAVLLGQGADPAGYDTVADSVPIEQLAAYLSHLKASIAQAAASMHRQ